MNNQTLKVLRTRSLVVLAVAATIGLMTWLWYKTTAFSPEDHAHVDSALRELRSLDRTINQDVLRARYQLIENYEPVLRSYRRIEDLEDAISTPPKYLDSGSAKSLVDAVIEYRASVTNKQAHIEEFKYRTADLKELLAYLPGAGTGVANAAFESGDERLAAHVNRVLQQTLLYNLTSDEKYAPIIRGEVDRLAASAEDARSYGVKRRVRTLVINIRKLLEVKPEVDRLLTRIFEEPVIQHEENVASIYYGGYTAAAHAASRYRLFLYTLCIVLVGLVLFGVRRLQQTAKALAKANEHLEERVADRTRELDARNREMRIVLDNVDQALFTVNMAGELSQERSAALDRWFPHATAGTRLWDMVAPADATVATRMEMAWEDLRDGMLPPEVILDQIPRELAFKTRQYHIGFRPIGDENNLEKVLLVISDVTEVVERTRREADQREQLVVFQHLMKDRPGFMEFFAEAERLALGVINERYDDTPTLTRALHTLKGNCGMYGITSVATLCHDLEASLLENPEGLGTFQKKRFSDTWAAFAERVRMMSGAAGEERLELSRTELRTLQDAIAEGKNSSDLLRMLRHMEREPVERRLARISEQAKQLARRLGKGEVMVKTESNDVRLDKKRWAPFWAAFVHMLRNALDHGLEPAEERVAAGKKPLGQLCLRTHQVDDEIVVEITDDGRGINWDAIQVRARQLGLKADTQEDLVAVLCRGGVSTKEIVTEFSGRAAGVSACYSACREMGGELTVVSTRGKGTTFRFAIPSDEAGAPALAAAS